MASRNALELLGAGGRIDCISEAEMILTGTRAQLELEIVGRCPAAIWAADNSKGIKGQLLFYQALALYALTERYNKNPAHILEIGTALGYSASIMAQAAPKARITTLNTSLGEVELARKNLTGYQNIHVVNISSWDYLGRFAGAVFDMIFVDGDHKRVRRDMPWFNLLKVGGLMLFHDYTPITSADVYETINGFSAKLGRGLDIQIVDNDQIGMAGFYKMEGEIWE